MAKETVKKETKVSKESVTVTWSAGVRVYSVTDHGADFEKLAQEFAGKVGGKVV